jgi:hypothetical protein
MRTHQQTDRELKDLLKAEQTRFKELDTLKKAMWEGLAADNAASLQEWELLKAQWQDSADEIKYLHRKLHPYFPRGHACPNCGCDTMPVSGSNAVLDSCVACGTITDRWSL